MTIWLLHLPPEAVAQKSAALPLPFPPVAELAMAGYPVHVRSRLHAANPEATPESLDNETHRLWKWLHDITHDDVLMIMTNGSEALHFAQVTGGIRAEADNAARYVLPVRWFTETMPVKRLKRWQPLFRPTPNVPVEVDDMQARAAIRARLPLTANRFAKWRWALALIVLLHAVKLLHRFITETVQGAM